MSVRGPFIRWAIAGAAMAILLLWTQQAAVGGITGLLQVGETSDLRPIIENELGEVPLAPGAGHDGQIFYAMGLDLLGQEVGPLLDHPGYRYRRILYPALSSGFGLLDGYPLLYGMLGLTVVSVAIAAGAAAALAVRHQLSQYVGLTVILNPGVWLATRLLTSDTLALALMMVGLLLVSRMVTASVASFALSTLAKDLYLFTPAGLAVGRTPRRWLPLAGSVAVLGLWTLWVGAQVGSGQSGWANLDLPFLGWIESWPTWGQMEARELLYLIFALLSVIGGLVIGLTRSSWLRWPILGWSILGIISSSWVWDLGNNAARAFAPILVLVALSFGNAPEMSAPESRPRSAAHDLP